MSINLQQPESGVRPQGLGYLECTDMFCGAGGSSLVLGDLIAHPSTVMKLRNNGRTPLWTKHMLGAREAERDCRRR